MIKKIIFQLKLIWYGKILKQDTMDIKVQKYRDLGAKIGKNMRAFSPLLSAESYLLEFGDNITVSTGVKFTTHDNAAIKIIPNRTDIFGRIKIGNNCFIGQNTLILPGVELADNIIVGAGSVVTKSFKEEGIIIAGNPAKQISTIEDYHNKYKDNALNIKRGVSSKQKKNLIISNESMLIKK